MKNVKLRKALTTVLAAAMAVGVCASCAPTSTSSGDKVQITVGGWPSTEGASLDRMNNYKEGFEKENTNIEIVPDTWSFDLKSFYPKAEAGMLPNVYITAFTEIDKLIDGGYALDLTDALKKHGYYDNMNEKIKELVSRDGKTYALPYEAYALGIAYNTEMYEAAGLVEADGAPIQPKTWVELAEQAVKIKEATGKPGIVLTTANNCGGWIFTNIAWSYGVDFMEQREDGSWEATFNTDEATAALQYIKDLRWKYNVLPENLIVDQSEQQKTFATGGAAVMISAPVAGRLASYEMKPDGYGMMAIPAGPVKHVSLVGGANRNLSNKSDEAQIDAALKWIDYIGAGYRFDDTVKENMEKTIKTDIENGNAVGIKSLQIWKDDSEKTAYNNKLIDENSNMKPNSAKLYNDSLNDPSIEMQPEEPVCAQDLYGLLDNCIQQVLSDENADCKAIMEKANQDFQTNYLNNIEY